MPEDNYPTEQELQEIKDWKIESTKDMRALLMHIGKLWNWPDWGIQVVQGKDGPKNVERWFLSTGGWSGNEAIIGALQHNTLFWMFCWQESKRGGHYMFQVPEEARNDS